MAAEQIKIEISNAIKAFSSGDLTKNSMHLYQTLGYNTQRSAHLSKPDFKTFRESYLTYNSNFNEAKAFISEWKYVDLLFQLSKSEVLKQTTLFDTKKIDNTLIETYLFFVIELKGNQYTRGNLSSITREVNKVFPMPVMILFRHNNSLTLSVINRRLHKRDETKDVLEKVTLIKEIDILHPHRAHIEILFDLSFEQLKYKHNFTNFVELHEAWQKTLDTKELNKKFFQELANWYFWAISKTVWPDDDEQLKKKEVRNATNVIRLITRLVFIWFLKEKKLVDDVLFNEKELKSILNNSDPNDSTYYKAILQNLFFATLNTPLDKRTFRTKRNYQGKNSDRGNPFVFRYEDYFNKDITELYEHIPFLNGGLFDCLDYKNENAVMVHIDGFSEEKNNPLKVPDTLFFSKPKIIDLSDIYNDNKKSKSEVRGLINILDSYKFTITENTPIEEEVALDPELLGRVFENLLAYYNPETETTARKQTGSFYTPREIVNYMVDESLIAYLKTKILKESFSYLELGSDQMDLLGNKSRKGQLKIEEDLNPNRWIGKEESLENELRSLLSYSDSDLHFSLEEKKALVKAIDNIKVLDPSCGSGAFPMGMLHKLVHILHRLDPQNQMWKQKQIEFASQIQETTARGNALKNIEEIFNPENNFADYGRKLFLIRNCIYGVDIQPIAIQIAKLRFFISLLIDQSINNKKDYHNIDPLPNLESKFVAANTLIGLQKSTSTGNLFDENYDKIVQLKTKFENIRKKYFDVRLPQEKKKLHDEYLRTRDELIKIIKKDKGYTVDAPLLVEYDPYNPLNVSPFFDPEWMFGFNSFDVVIGNPPYVNFRDIKIKGTKDYFFENYKSIEYQSDLFVIFIEKGFQLLSEKMGSLSLIVPNSLTNNLNNSKIRKFILSKSTINCLVDAPLGVFESATVDTIILCVSLIKSKKNIRCLQIINNKFELLEYKNQEEFEKNLNCNFDFLIPNAFVKLVKKIEMNTIPLDSICDSSSGIKEYETGKGNPPQTEKNRIKKVFNSTNKLSNEYWKHLTGSEIENYIVRWSNSYLKYGPWLAAPRDEKYFKGERIVIREIPGKDRLKAAYISEKYTIKNTAHIFIPESKDFSIKYLVALLNSKLMGFYFRNKFSEKDDVFPKAKIGQCRLLPIKLSEIQKPFITLIDRILEIKKQNQDANTMEIEKQIDELVYKLYGLTEEEIKIIEGNIKD